MLNAIEIQILRTTTDKPFYEKILLSLTICDLLNATLGSVSLLLFLVIQDRPYFLLLIWVISLYGVWFSALVSLLHLIFISFDRLWAISFPLHHRRYNSKTKLVIALASSWGIPSLLMLATIIYVITQKLTLMAIYIFVFDTIFSTAATIILIADVAFLFSYSAIICITFSRKKDVAVRNQRQQSRFGNTLILCMSIVLIFVVFTTPFVVGFLTTWRRPYWFGMLSVGLFTMNQISNSTAFLIQRYRTKRSMNRLANNRNVSVNTESTRH